MVKEIHGNSGLRPRSGPRRSACPPARQPEPAATGRRVDAEAEVTHYRPWRAGAAEDEDRGARDQGYRTQRAYRAQAAPSPTEREREIVALVGTGMSNAEIADHLTLSPLTVKTHANHAMTKLGAHDRAQLVVFAYQAGLGGTRDHAGAPRYPALPHSP